MDLDDPFPRELPQRLRPDRRAAAGDRPPPARRWRPSACATRSCSSRRLSPTWSPTRWPGSMRPTGRRRRCSGWASGSWPASRWPPMSRAATAGSSARWSTGCAWATRAGWLTGCCGSGGAAARCSPSPSPWSRSRATTAGWRPCAGCCARRSRRRRPAWPSRPHAAAQDDARRRDLEALEDLDVAADLDGTVQVLLDAGVRLLGVDGIGLMLADGQAGCAPPAAPTTPSSPSCGPRSMVMDRVHAFLLGGASRPAAWTAAGAGPSWPRRPPSTPWARPWPADRARGRAGRGLPAGVGPAAGLDRHRAAGGRGLRLGAGRDAGAGRRGPAAAGCRASSRVSPGPGGRSRPRAP